MIVTGGTRRTATVRYAAFLRAVDVGGRHPVPPAELARRLDALGLSDVRTFPTGGDVVFGARRTSPDAVGRRIAGALREWLGYSVAVMVRTLAELRHTVAGDPFGGCTEDDALKLYVALLAEPPRRGLALPFVSDGEGLEAFAVHGRDVFLVSRRVKGRFGFPNDFVERELGTPATTRDWSTIVRIVDAERAVLPGPRTSGDPR